MQKVIYQSNDYRILEAEDNYVSMDDLKGEMFDPKVITDIPVEQLRKEEKEFEDFVNANGAFGYVLEKWNPEVDAGWQHLDSCWGFVGQYDEHDPKFKHDIVDEYKLRIKELGGEK